jgi:hypothetical protein
MGTRNLICVVVDGQYRVAQYGQWDGYPEGQGKDILEFLRGILKQNKLNEFADKVRQCQFLSDEELEAQWNLFEKANALGLVSFEAADRHNAAFPENSRDTGAKILNLIMERNFGLKIQNSLDFAADSLMCEYAYVVDLDKKTFEIYRGFQQQELNEKERFAGLTQNHLTKDYKASTDEQSYYPVAHWKTHSLDKLPTEKKFLKDLTEKAE